MKERQTPKILVVEDNDADVHLLREAMRQHQIDADLQVLQDGELAIQYVKKRETDPTEAPDLVLLDLNLPKRNGLEVLEVIRCTDAFRQVPVIVITSSTSLEEREQSERLGVDTFFHKSFELDEFIQIGDHIKRSLKMNGGSGED